jgi:hypothetical protein
MGACLAVTALGTRDRGVRSEGSASCPSAGVLTISGQTLRPTANYEMRARSINSVT